MCALRISNGARTALAGTNCLKTILQGGVMDIYSGGQPATAEYAETGIKLLRISVNSGTSSTQGLTFGTAALGVLPKSADVWSGLVSVAGVAGYFRFYGTGGTSGSSNSENRIDGNVGISGSDMVLANTSLVAGATLTIDTFSLTIPAA
jgi:hypothetical protein